MGGLELLLFPSQEGSEAGSIYSHRGARNLMPAA